MQLLALLIHPDLEVLQEPLGAVLAPGAHALARDDPDLTRGTRRRDRRLSRNVADAQLRRAVEREALLDRVGVALAAGIGRRSPPTNDRANLPGSNALPSSVKPWPPARNSMRWDSCSARRAARSAWRASRSASRSCAPGLALRVLRRILRGVARILVVATVLGHTVGSPSRADSRRRQPRCDRRRAPGGSPCAARSPDPARPATGSPARGSSRRAASAPSGTRCRARARCP